MTDFVPNLHHLSRPSGDGRSGGVSDGGVAVGMAAGMATREAALVVESKRGKKFVISLINI